MTYRDYVSPEWKDFLSSKGIEECEDFKSYLETSLHTDLSTTQLECELSKEVYTEDRELVNSSAAIAYYFTISALGVP